MESTFFKLGSCQGPGEVTIMAVYNKGLRTRQASLQSYSDHKLLFILVPSVIQVGKWSEWHL